nr:hypothetical protein Iba_chr11fCG2060 [Ipomoea batatas]
MTITAQMVCPNLTASKMSAISPVYICTTVIICMNECVDDHLVYLILNVHVVATYNDLNKGNITATDALIAVYSLKEFLTNAATSFLHMLPQKLHHWSWSALLDHALAFFHRLSAFHSRRLAVGGDTVTRLLTCFHWFCSESEMSKEQCCQ